VIVGGISRRHHGPRNAKGAPCGRLLFLPVMQQS
jgi:hypothetical protein